MSDPHWIIANLIDLLGLAGAVMVSVPFLGESAIKRLLDWLRLPIPLGGLERAERKAAAVAESELLRFKPGDRWWVLGGLAAIALSYLLHIYTLWFSGAWMPTAI